MSSTSKKKAFRFTPQVLIRLIIFSAIMYLSINYFSTQGQGQAISMPNILGVESSSEILNNLYLQLPPSSRQTLENLPSSPQAKYVQEKIDYLKQQTDGFPQKQIKEMQKTIIRSILQNYIDN